MYRVVWILALFVTGAQGKQWVRIYVDRPQSQIQELLKAGVTDITAVSPKGYIDALVDPTVDLSRWTTVILDPDIEQTFQRWRDEGLMVNFGPYYTYAEATAQLDSIHAQYPDLTTEKISIGLSIEGRDIWAMKISDHPDQDEGEPAVLLTGVHHAREPIGCTITIEFAKYLLSHYGTDPLITWLVDNRELWIVPIVNPDGYVYNEFSSDGYWRKNKRDNNNNGYFDPSYDGVDLNRNYGYMWAYDDWGSSPYPGDQTYRGTAPFSEPETEAIRELCDSIQPTIALNYHSYSNLLIYPYGYDNIYTPDHQAFVAMAQIMTAVNGYTYGTPWELLYPVNGSSDDWMYGEQTEKPKIFAFTPEVGEAFWQPDESTIQEQFQENLSMNLYVLKAAGSFADLVSLSVTDQGDSSELDPGDTLSIVVSLRDLSPVAPITGVQGTLRLSDTLYLTLLDSVADFGDLDPLPAPPVDNSLNPYRISVAPPFPSGGVIQAVLHLSAPSSNFEVDIPIHILVGTPQVVFQDSLTTMDQWITGGNQMWGLSTTTYHSPPSSATDSPYGNYNNNVSTYLRLAHPIDLTDATFARLIFYHKYDIEDGWDYGYVQVSTDTTNWQTVATYTGTQTVWQPDTIDLTNFVGDSLWIRFLLVTDVSVTEDGWYVDDVTVERDVAVVQVEEPRHYDLPFTSLQFSIRQVQPKVFEITTNRSASATVTLYDITGQRVATVFQGQFPPGKTRIRIPQSLTSGVYFLRVQAGQTVKTLKFISFHGRSSH